MDHPEHQRLLSRLIDQARLDQPAFGSGDDRLISAASYRCPERLQRERDLMQRTPTVIGHASDVAERGACLLSCETGPSTITVRDKAGTLRRFLNACRHRGTQLITESCRRKSFVCSYHGWTYQLDGSLKHVPHPASFPKLNVVDNGLASVDVCERHGLVWNASAAAVDDHLGELGDELDALKLDDHVVFRRVQSQHPANWKLLVDAFLENYHIRYLHKGTIYPFFLDAVSVFDRVGPHLRAATARRKLAETTEGDARTLMTVSYHLFPTTFLIIHPDYISRLTISPVATNRLRWTHDMLVPSAMADDAHAPHWARSFELIENGVFQREDVGTAIRMQVGLDTGANEHMRFGQLEQPAVWFHDALARALDSLKA